MRRRKDVKRGDIRANCHAVLIFRRFFLYRRLGSR